MKGDMYLVSFFASNFVDESPKNNQNEGFSKIEYVTLRQKNRKPMMYFILFIAVTKDVECKKGGARLN